MTFDLQGQKRYKVYTVEKYSDNLLYEQIPTHLDRNMQAQYYNKQQI